MDVRQPFDPYGCHRVIEPSGALPQAAERLDASGPLFSNEVAIDVERLNIDSASFHQIVDEVGEDTEAVGKRVLSIVENRGKMENPVTGSGGMLLGTVGAVGPDYDGPVELVVGDRIATLVSLTLTPLELDQVTDVAFEADQIVADGRAYLTPSAPLVVMPDDLDDTLAVSVFDVCGAPARTRRLCRDHDSVLILGAGRSGMLCAAAAHHTFEQREVEDPWIGCIDLNESNPKHLAEHGIIDDWATADATTPTAVLEVVEQWRPQLPELVVNACNVPGTEMSAVLGCRRRGTAYFFNMATSFSRAALGAEGVGRDVDLLIGNGYTEGHAEYALKLVREMPAVRERIEDIVLGS